LQEAITTGQRNGWIITLYYLLPALGENLDAYLSYEIIIQKIGSKINYFAITYGEIRSLCENGRDLRSFSSAKISQS